MNRFYFEYTNMIAVKQYKDKFVQWYVDTKGITHMYIVTDQNSVYYYSVHFNRIPPKFNSVLDAKGMILEVIGVEKEKTQKQIQDTLVSTHEALKQFRLKF